MRKDQVSDPIRHPLFYAWLSKLRDRGSKSLQKTPSIDTRTKTNKIKPLGRDRNSSWRKNKQANTIIRSLSKRGGKA